MLALRTFAFLWARILPPEPPLLVELAFHRMPSFFWSELRKPTAFKQKGFHRRYDHRLLVQGHQASGGKPTTARDGDTSGLALSSLAILHEAR